MKNKNLYNVLAILLLLVLSIAACSNSNDDLSDGGGTSSDYLTITLKPSTVYQTIHSFGASDAWSTQFVGKNWPLAKRNQIADYLFSSETDDNGQPKGIGLSTWRFNIGGGSDVQGSDSGISDEWRRAESFLTSSGYNWDAQEGQRWFLQAAKERGVNEFTAFSNSPPIVLTKNGKAHSSGGSSANLDAANYNSYADFLANVIENIRDNEGITFNYISPFNEPQWDWTGGQEGTPWLNSEIAAITKILDSKIESKNLNTKIEIAESAQLNYLYEDSNKSGRGSHIQEFFDASSSNYVGDLNNIAHKICGHSYYTTSGNTTLINTRQGVKDQIQQTDSSLEFWMSEYCLLENNSQVEGNGRDLGIDPALYLGKVIHTDLTVANASSWQWWIAVSPYDYKDGLVYIDENKFDGEVYDSKLLWALGNYSYFIKEGYQRINLNRSDNKSIEQSIDGLLVSAYKKPDDSKYVVVLVNQRTIDIPINVKIDGKSNYSGKLYQTSAESTDNLSPKESIDNSTVWSIPARSIVTVVVE
ncbi:hypothetical protein APS56_11335 [Pseudalgibacter alginicilyticus]|uniref:Xylanase n=1 Tax=Pseudalgibacter alginicilyticus TaxID=1736674 RepID=A0A0P0CMF3_9FLAO|nr:glycoside hydrolase [Pseudalgibacter alginicilyticus]ALJ05680.1 hypothetical protein APS56_11335 [Pseudalgibacter alginicilyticus]